MLIFSVIFYSAKETGPYSLYEKKISTFKVNKTSSGPGIRFRVKNNDLSLLQAKPF